MAVPFGEPAIHNLSRFDETTVQGRELLEAYERESFVPPAPELRSQLLGLRDMMIGLLQDSRFDAAGAKFDELIAGRRHRTSIWWFELTPPGRRSIRSLPKELNHVAEYDILYTRWSEVAHANGYNTFFKDGGFPSVRAPHELRQVLSLTSSLQLRATRLLINYYRPGESVKAWYEREVQAAYVTIASATVNITDVSDAMGTRHGQSAIAEEDQRT